MTRIYKYKHLSFILVSLIIILLAYFILPSFFPSNFKNIIVKGNTQSTTTPLVVEEPKFVVTHVKTPVPLKGIYMSACVAATPSFREKLLKIAKTTEINSIMIDVKDYTGTISFVSENPLFKENIGAGCKVKDLKEFIGELHKNDVYVIARISSFQDKYLVSKRPELAVKRNSDGGVWKDYKGVSWLDVGSKDTWDYLVALAKESYDVGFDEINFDYIRFPSDGNMKDIYYPFSNGKVKPEVMKDFYIYLSQSLKDLGAPISADFFGMTMTNTDDLNIGQVLEDALPYFDYIAPMVYPSHYPSGFNGYKDVNAHPYDIVKFSMDRGVERTKIATSSPSKLRPWLQDNDYPVKYTPEMIRAQIQATYDSGLDSWMLWDAGNTYTVDALLSKNFSTTTER
ncbi:MAG: putative glycoside hydrolase [Candidatus Paceibacterota bacterium]